MNEVEILEEIEKLEKEKMDYLEADDKAAAKRKEKKIKELQTKLELLNLSKIKKELELYKKFVNKRGMQIEFKNFVEGENK